MVHEKTSRGSSRSAGLWQTWRTWRVLPASLSALIWLALSAGGGAAQAQAPVATSAAPSAASCLVKPAEPLKYPKRAEKLRQSARLLARLSFAAADQPPEVEVLAFAGTEAMNAAAETYLRGYRLPCLAAGERLVLDQEVRFTAIGGDDARRTASRSELDCLRTPESLKYYEDLQTGTLIKQKTRGNLLLELQFSAPDAPPSVTTQYNSAPTSFANAVGMYVEAYRLPCFKPGSEPVVVQQVFQYAGSARRSDLALNDLGLVDFLRSVKDVDKVPVKFDLDRMACPFKVRWTLYQPAADNDVMELGPPVAARGAFLAWLASLSMDLGRDQFEGLLGSQMVITVPCGKVEL